MARERDLESDMEVKKIFLTQYINILSMGLEIRQIALPLEKNQELLMEYGRAFALINFIDATLTMILTVRGGLINADSHVRQKILDKMLLGEKIRLCEKFLDKSIMKQLWQLNENRLILAHGVTVKREDEIIIIFKSESKEFTEKFLLNISAPAKALLEKLLDEV